MFKLAIFTTLFVNSARPDPNLQENHPLFGGLLPKKRNLGGSLGNAGAGLEHLGGDLIHLGDSLGHMGDDVGYMGSGLELNTAGMGLTEDFENIKGNVHTGSVESNGGVSAKTGSMEYSGRILATEGKLELLGGALGLMEPGRGVVDGKYNRYHTLYPGYVLQYLPFPLTPYYGAKITGAETISLGGVGDNVDPGMVLEQNNKYPINF